MKEDPLAYRDKSHYDRLYEKSDVYYGSVETSPYLPVYRAVLNACRPHDTIIDIGCGTGQLAEVVAWYAYLLHYLFGADFSGQAIMQARNRMPNDRFMHVDVTKRTDVFEEDYDTAVFVETLEHVHDDLGLVNLVPPRRRVVLSVPDFPAEGHVRYFESVADAVTRYEGPLEIEDVKVVKGRGRWFVIAGRRR